MIIDSVSRSQFSELRTLWAEAFGDENEFDVFFASAFSQSRCRVALIDNKIAAALYWFDCEIADTKMAYIYGVATKKEHQNKGIARALIENTHIHLRTLEYSSAILVPSNKQLFSFYEKLGYKHCTNIQQFTANSSNNKAELVRIDSTEYSIQRKRMLPENSIIQDNENIIFLERIADLYLGDDFLLAVRKDPAEFLAYEMLGNIDKASDVLKALGFDQGIFRTYGGNLPFTMLIELNKNAVAPYYFGLAFD